MSTLTFEEMMAVVDRPYLVRLGPPSSGDVIHRSDCTYVERHPNPLRWAWADRKGYADVDWDALRRGGIRPCRHCHAELLREF